MGLADFLFPSSVQNILRVVYSSPERQHTLKELITAAGNGRGNGQRHVENLLRTGVLQEGPRFGHARTLSANTAHPLYPELQGIYKKSFGLVEPIREALAPFCERIEEAFVFGSVAKGRDTYQSDVDLLVVGTLSTMDLLSRVSRAEKVVGRSIHLNFYAPDEWEELKLNDPVVRNIAEGDVVRIYPETQ